MIHHLLLPTVCKCVYMYVCVLFVCFKYMGLFAIFFREWFPQLIQYTQAMHVIPLSIF